MNFVLMLFGIRVNPPDRNNIKNKCTVATMQRFEYLMNWFNRRRYSDIYRNIVKLKSLFFCLVG